MATAWSSSKCWATPHRCIPNVAETIKAAEVLVKDGFQVMVYTSDDPIVAKQLEDIGCVAVMPLASLIGSGMGILNPWNLQIIIDRLSVPVIVDAGVGTASDATIAMELGCDAVLMNTAIAGAGNPVLMASAMKKAVEAGREAFLAGRMPKKIYQASPSSPTSGLITEKKRRHQISMTTDTGAHPRIRSYVLRAGRVGPGQARALAEIGPQCMLPYQPGLLDLDAAFGRAAPRILEIGFGMGEGLAEIAAAHPENDYLGVEVHTPGVGALLKQVGERGLTNVRVIQHDAVEVLTRMLAPASLAGVHIFFPDPWHKKRHHKRRLIQPPLVALAGQPHPAGRLHSSGDRLAGLRRADARGARRRAAAGKYGGRLRAASRHAPAHQVRAARHPARARGVGSGFHGGHE